MGDYDKSIEHSTLSFNMYAKIYSESHPDLINFYCDQGDIYYKMK